MSHMPKSLARQPRAIGAAYVALRSDDGETRLADLRQSGSLRALFPRPFGAAFPVVLTNTSGGVTGGDDFAVRISLREGAAASVTTQAAERAYRAQPGETGAISNRLDVGAGARLHWLPQETILFEGSSLDRRLRADLAQGASAVIVEPLVFGRGAMGEELHAASFRDRIEIRREGRIVFLDQIRFDGDIAAELAHPATADGGCAMASLIFIDSEAAACLDRARALAGDGTGISMVADDILVARLVAADGFALRQQLIPLIRLVTGDDLPRPWTI